MLKEDFKGKINEDDIIAFSMENMAKYKAPTKARFVDALPKNQVGRYYVISYGKCDKNL